MNKKHLIIIIGLIGIVLVSSWVGWLNKRDQTLDWELHQTISKLKTK